MSPDSHPAASTIIARNYLGQARVLIDSFFEHVPDGVFYLLIVDGVPDHITFDARVRLLQASDLALDEVTEMSFKYDVTELCTAVKPSLLSHMLNNGHDHAVYFDPDIVVYRPLTELWQLLAGATIVLIPHLLEPIPADGRHPDEQDILAAGAYNLGFIGVRASAETTGFLAWWQDRLKDKCRVDVPRALFVDQKWIDLVPSLYPGTAILRDDTYDVAYWNLPARTLELREDASCLVNGRPLAFFHFSGFDPLDPRRLSKHQDRLSVEEGSPLALLLDDYAARLRRHGFAMTRAWPYGYGRFDHGVAISGLHRRLYLELSAASRRRFRNPFAASGPESFFLWSVSPQIEYGGLSPFQDRILVERQDLVKVLPDPRGKNRRQFLAWAQRDGATQMGYDPRLIDPTVWRTPSGGAAAASAAASDGPAQGGVNVCGYLRNETGLGAITRGFVRALQAKGVPLGFTDLAELSPNRSHDPTLAGVGSSAPYGINLVCVNADQHFVVKQHLGDAFFRGHYNIGVWFWELPSFPREWHDRFADYDEIWATSSFIADTLAAVSPIPIVRVPPVLTAPARGSRAAGRERLGVGAEDVVYLFIFDFASYAQRKNPLGTIAAFRRAFAPDQKVHLAIKCVNEQFDPGAFALMQERAAGHAVSIHTGYWSVDEMGDLMAASDAYVSLHRSEGLGLTIADAMAAGKPVIATAWSGNTDFMTATNSFPVGYELVELREDVGPYRAGSVWAEPSIDQAAALMRLVHDDRELATARGQAASKDIQQNYSEAVVGQVIQQRLAVAAARQAERRPALPYAADSAPAPADPPAAAAISGRAPRVPPMDLGSSSHGSLGILAKRGVDLLLRYHTHYQGELNLSFASFMRELAAEQTEIQSRLDLDNQRIDALAADRDTVHVLLDAIRARLDAITAEQERSAARINARFAARPYMSVDAFAAMGKLAQPMGYAENGNGAPPDFPDLFRGSEEFIKERQRIYLPFFDGRRDVVDLGSGRGELLELLREQGIDAVGVELDPQLVERGRQRGQSVELAEALDYLAKRSADSLDVVFSAQVIEHVPSERLLEFLVLARRTLRRDGILIAETVNPESFEALKTFYVDLTHQRPIYPQVLLYLCQQAGFRSARIFYPNAGGFSQEQYEAAGEYAVVAVC